MSTQEIVTWWWKQTDLNVAFQKCLHWPSQIHLELISAGIIADPRHATAEKDCQWVDQRSWTYRGEFFFQKHGETFVDLIFEGLDTFSTIYINGIRVSRTENMFRRYTFTLTEEYLSTGRNQIDVVFDSAKSRGRRLFEKGRVGAVSNGDPSRLYVRKAAFHYGWDWGPVLNTCGIWKPVYLHQYEIDITSQQIEISLSNDYESAQLAIAIELKMALALNSHLEIEVVVLDPHGSICAQATEFSLCEIDEVEKRTYRTAIVLDNPELWWPVGYGKQALYHLSTKAVWICKESGKQFQATIDRTVGMRRVELIQEPLLTAPGKSFFFEINSVPIFCGGSNWIPADSFHCRMSQDRYTAWINKIKSGRQNMLRVWGGGIYEDDIFYRLCDEAGILVWQDFMFACGQYPYNKEFAENVCIEAKQNLVRIRDHPCIVILAGNNEDYEIATSIGAYSKPHNDGDWDSIEKSNFPARLIYEKLFPEIVHRLAPSIAYWPGSPYGGSAPSDPTVGDLHQWNVWHGSQKSYQEFGSLTGRFISEFGMQGLPDLETHKSWLSGCTESEFHPQSETNAFHNKATGADRRLAIYMNENFRYNMDNLADYIYSTQLMQHDAITYAYRMSRREWQGPGRRHCGGALVWQANDVWPCTSWSIVDYYLRPKAAYYAIKREMRPLHVGSERHKRSTKPPLKSRFQHPPSTEFYYGPWKHTVAIWGLNSTVDNVHCVVDIHVFDIESGSEVPDLHVTLDTTLAANSSTEIIEEYNLPSDLATSCVVSISLCDKESQKPISRTYSWPEPFKFLYFPERSIQVRRSGLRNETLQITADKPIRGMVLRVEGRDIEWSDNCFDLCPGESQNVVASDICDQDVVRIRYYGQKE